MIERLSKHLGTSVTFIIQTSNGFYFFYTITCEVNIRTSKKNIFIKLNIIVTLKRPYLASWIGAESLISLQVDNAVLQLNVEDKAILQINVADNIFIYTLYLWNDLQRAIQHKTLGIKITTIKIDMKFFSPYLYIKKKEKKKKKEVQYNLEYSQK